MLIIQSLYLDPSSEGEQGFRTNQWKCLSELLASACLSTMTLTEQQVSFLLLIIRYRINIRLFL